MAEQERTSFNSTNIGTDYTVYTRPDIGLADGYSEYSKTTGSKAEHVKTTSSNLLLDNQSGKFRRIPGYSLNRTVSSDEYENPTFLIFDLSIVKYESPLFRDDVIGAFLNEYSDAIPELNERINLWTKFVDLVLKIFPSDSIADTSGSKQHYIESISGLDVLLNPIINYPEDKITFTITEDIAMTLQYLSELYNNLVYSYDTHRYLIPDNLLRFNMKITIRDVRNMRKPYWNTSPTSSNFNDNISSFIYVLHDCQFDFMKTKNFTGEIRRGGFGSNAPGLSAGGTVDMNFKSYSKIMAPLLIDNSTVLDFREKESQNGDKDLYKVFTRSDYKTQAEISETELNDFNNKTRQTRSATDIISTSNQNKRPGEIHFPEINTNIRGFANTITKEITQVRQVIINQILEEANQLITRGERALANRLGFTIGKVNVYYSSLTEKVTRFSFLFEQFLEKKVDKLLDRNVAQPTLRLGNVYSPTNTDVESHYNEKIPSGDVNPDGTYNEKYPKGVVQPTGTYNEKYPEGDLHPSGTYNEKYPSGDVNPNGTYNEKYPEGDVNPNGTYNEKYPSGDVNPNGTYNEKYPSGDVNPPGQYNEKYPEGDVNPNGTYNEKYPSGDVNPPGQYNQKYPEGDLMPKGTYNDKYPEGDLMPKGTYNEKIPSGRVEEDGQYNEKIPKGDLMPKGVYNEKKPSGRVQPDGQYNEKSPNGIVEPKGTYNEKPPKGRVEEEGKYNDKPPVGNIYSNKKHKPLPPTKLKLGNVNRQK